MKLIAIIIVLIHSLAGESAQLFAQSSPCRYFVERKHGDTVVVPGLYKGIELFLEKNSALRYLEKKGQLDADDFMGRINFQPKGCDSTYSLFFAEKRSEGLDVLSRVPFGELLFTCVVYRDHKIPGYSNKPFVLITAVNLPKGQTSNYKERGEDSCQLFSRNSKSRDTIRVKAIYKGMQRYLGSDAGMYLEKKKILKDSDFNSVVMFQPEGCEATYNLFCMNKSKEGEIIVNGEPDQKCIVTCVIFRNSKIPDYSKKPFAIITKIEKSD